MDQHIDRRGFAATSSAALSSLLFLQGGVTAGDEREGPEREGPDQRLVLLGLNALARAHEMNYFADGHRGASMVSAHLLCVDNGLDGQTTSRIAELFDLNWASSKLCKPFPEADPDPAGIEKIGTALLEGGDVLRQVGHNVIFAMLAIKAFRMIPSAATPERVDGVCALIRSFTPWHDIEPDPAINPPPFTDAAAASKFILRETNTAIDRFVGFGQGFAGHMLTFGQSIVELAAMGDVELAESCRTAFRKYVTVTRLGPEADARRIADHKPSTLRPNQSAYWEKRGDHTMGLGHVFKYPYGYYDLLRRADDAVLSTTLNAKAYQIF